MAQKDLPYKHKGDLTTGPVRGHLVRMTIPMIWGLLAIISTQLIDTYFISMLGTTELAGVSFTFPVTMIITHLVFGVNIAMSSVLARLIGEKKMEDVRRVTLHGLIMAFCVSGTIAVICFLSLDPLFRMLGADETTLPVVQSYMPLWLLASVVLAIPTNANSATRASGDTFLPAIVMTSIAFINLVLDPIFIFGLLGAPALGVKGAALATLIAFTWGAGLALYIVRFKKDLLPRTGLHLDQFRDSLKRLVVIAIPAGVANIIMPLTNALIIALLAGYGAEAVAAFGVASRLEAFALLIVIALALGMAPIVGQNWGARNFERVHEAINTSIGFNFIWSFLIAILMGVFARQIAGAFSDDAAVIHYATLFFWIVPFSYAFSNLVFGWSSAFNAMGMPKRAFVLIALKAATLTVAVLIGSWSYGVAGIFAAMALTGLVIGTAMHITSWRVCLTCEREPVQA